MPGDLDLDDPCSLPPTERPPDLPPPIAMTVSKQTKPNNHHGDPSTFLFCFIFLLVLQRGLSVVSTLVVSDLDSTSYRFFELIHIRREFRGHRRL